MRNSTDIPANGWRLHRLFDFDLCTTLSCPSCGWTRENWAEHTVMKLSFPDADQVLEKKDDEVCIGELGIRGGQSVEHHSGNSQN